MAESSTTSLMRRLRAAETNRSQSVFDFIIGIHPGLSRKDIGYFTDSKGKRMQVTAAERDDKHLELIKLSNNLFAVN